MRTKKWILPVFFLIALLLAGCGAGANETQKSSGEIPDITGKWVFEAKNNTSIIMLAQGHVEGSLTINSDGTGSVHYSITGTQSKKTVSGDYDGTYTQKEDTLTIDSDQLEDPVTVDYEIDDDGLLNITYKGYTIKLTKEN